MKVGKITALALTALVALPAAAQTARDGQHLDTQYFYQELNALENIYDGTDNPVALSHNRVHTVADAQVNARFQNGKFHDADEGRKAQQFGASIFGLQRFGKLSLSGSFDYQNAKSFDNRWNNTLFVTATNPFTLGDSIPSHVNTETFNMSAAASYEFCPLFTGALSLRYKTGSRSDQTDPRPKTDAMHFVINPGFEFHLSPVDALGLSATVDLFRSDISHTLVNNNYDHIYYVMKGMGDYFKRTSDDLGSYPRDYKGNRFEGSLQYVLTPTSGKVRNLVAVAYSHNKEVAEDGGYSFTFKAGDYYRQDIRLTERLALNLNEHLAQNFTLRFNYATDSGDWYDQKRETDPEHGNISSYKVVNKSTIREGKYISAGFGYQADLLRDGMPDFTFHFDADYDRTELSQIYTREFRQEYQLLTLQLGGVKHWHLGKVRLSGKLGGYYRMQLGDVTNDCVVKKTNDISRSYVNPSFEYATADQAGFHAEADVFLPVTVYKYQTWMGFTVRAASAFYLGDNTYSRLLNSGSRTFVDAAFHVIF